MYKSLLFLSVIILFSSENLYSETLIINIESKYDDGYAMLGIYDKKIILVRLKLMKNPMRLLF